jgi:hypothetical protein
MKPASLAGEFAEELLVEARKLTKNKSNHKTKNTQIINQKIHK